MELFRALRTALGDLPIVAEDWASCLTSVRELLKASGFPGMKVLQFGPDAHRQRVPAPQLPGQLRLLPGTHDNDTLLGWWERRRDRGRAQAADRVPGPDPRRGGEKTACCGGVLASPALLAVIPMADWLGLGSEARINVPGRADGNWQWRAADTALTTERAAEIRTMTVRYFRARKPKAEPAAAAAKEPAAKPDQGAKSADRRQKS